MSAPRIAIGEDAIFAASVRMFFEATAAERYFVALPTIGAAATVAIVAWVGHPSLWRAGLFVALVAAAETALNAVDRLFVRAPPPVERYAAWAQRKTVFVGALAAAFGLAPILLFDGVNDLTMMTAAWSIIGFLSGLIYGSSAYFPAIIAATVAAAMPTTVWYTLAGTNFERAFALSLGVTSLVFILFGRFTSRIVRGAVVARLETAALLAQQTALVAQVREAQSERTRFFGAASHDLRQPLQALGFYVALLPAARDAIQRKDIEARLAECAAGLDRQFNAIIGVADVDSAFERAAPRPHRLVDILRRAAANSAPEADRKGLRLVVVESGAWGMVDGALLERVVSNLVVNAVRYTEHGGVAIGVRPAAARARICVYDTGIGIAASEHARIFEDFYQVGNPGRNRDKGFGLGLSVVKRLCQAMGWEISLTSVPRKGSLFAVSVARTAPAPQAAQHDVEAESAGGFAEDLAVIAIDDDPLVCDSILMTLRQWGVAAQACRTGDEALALLAAPEPARSWCVLLDYRLGAGENGLDIEARIRAAHADAVRCILLTGETDEAIVAEAERRGLMVLRKPLKPIRLRAALAAPRGGARSVA